MLDTELQTRLAQLLTAKGVPAPTANTQATRITALIRDQLHPIATAATAIARGGTNTVRLRGIGTLQGLGDTASGVAGAAGGAKAGAAAGSVIPVVGTVVGAVVGAVAGYLIAHKNYLNVNSANSTEDQDALDIWPQYRRIAGSVAGRDLTLPLLERAWRGAVYTGSDFTLNNGRKCFHNGCLKYPGNPDWIHAAIYGAGGSNAQYTFPYAVANAGTLDPGAVAAFFIQHETQSPPWGRPSTPAGQQLLVDIADALVAAKGAPYTYGATQQSAALPQAIAPAAPTVPMAPGTATLPVMPGQAAYPMVATTPNTSSDQLLAALLAQQGINATSPQGQQLIRDVSAQGVQTAGFAGTGLPTWLVGGAAAVAVLMFALARPAGPVEMPKPKAAA